MVAGLEPWMLAGQRKHQLGPALGQRVGNRCNLDRFRTGPDDETDYWRGQFSPLARRGDSGANLATAQALAPKHFDKRRRGSHFGSRGEASLADE